MYVIATAGHVDHGKSTLVEALTSIDPDRWEEEKRRGLTIDLGFAWTTLPSGEDVAFVDVPGHERFLGNMLAGIGPAPMVMLVVAADEGWQAQSADHLDAITALRLPGVVVLTRADKPHLPGVREQVRARLAGTSLADAPVVEVSAATGAGLEELRRVLDEAIAAAPPADANARVRLWIDRAFSIKGAGTVVTGTLGAGTIAVGDSLELAGVGPVEVRGVHSENEAREKMAPVSRVALNLRGVEVARLHRGDVLFSPGAWPCVSVIDVALDAEVPEHLVAHIGTADLEVRVRPLGKGFARLTLARAVPLELGDRLVLRGPGSHHVLAGAKVLDLDPPELHRRGDARRRAAELAAGDTGYLKHRGAVRVERARLLGVDKPAGVIEFAGWWINAAKVMEWKNELLRAMEALDPLAAGLPRAQAVAGLPGPELLPLVVAAAKLELTEDMVVNPHATVDLGPEVAALAERFNRDPFDAPEKNDLRASTKQLAAAERAGVLLRLGDGVVVGHAASGRAKELLAALPQPFTTSQARQALGTTRRVAIPLLEYLDAHGVTKRLDGTRRQVAGQT